ncbi:hypothetical protein [Zunongwangia profunda]|uniref:hypothetical protein n=1 Tax=Zunongwangia profunda TaxID=398743 RepID=UPI00248F400F|nr:hypothetical protein [Zunongwangia profunda]|tara:strand:- start:22551 stop:23099 length:549 start_codon:yes stop_codon:yes gene_type:complete
MTLSYKTHWPQSMGPEYSGKPNHFVEKILSGISTKPGIAGWIYESGEKLGYAYADDILNKVDNSIPKLHTMRHDAKDRWKVGMKIHPVINNRTKNRFQFAPVLEVKSIQKVEIEHFEGMVQIHIDEKYFGEVYHYGLDDIYQFTTDLETLALNDGFPSVEAFFAWFNTDFTGKIIHWTDLKY